MPHRSASNQSGRARRRRERPAPASCPRRVLAFMAVASGVACATAADTHAQRLASDLLGPPSHALRQSTPLSSPGTGTPRSTGGSGFAPTLTARPRTDGERPHATPASRSDPLRHPPALRDRSPAPNVVEVRLTAAPARLPLLPGAETDVYAYDGRIPGPTLEVREGDRVLVHFRNELPESTTVHWHGLPVPFAADGSPFHPIAPGASYTYTFTVPPGTAGTYWYHPHPHHHTAWQVGMGLFGAIIVRAQDDPLPALSEKLLILSDNRFRPDGSLDFPLPTSERGRTDAWNGREGDVLFVNGQILPSIPIRAGEIQRWRVINASGARIFRLALPGHEMLHVGSDGGLFERPVPVHEILLANGERAELLVRGTGPPGSRARLQALPYDRYAPATRPHDWHEPRDLLDLAYSDERPLAPARLPARLRPVPALDPATATTTRTMRMSQGRINSRVMDLARVDVQAEHGATEIWEVRNLVAMDHPFHLHGFRFQVLDRDREPEPFRSWKDTVNVPGRGTVRFIVRYDGHPGRWMFHCHILDHEDAGMMGVLEVRGTERSQREAAVGERPPIPAHPHLE